MRFQQYYLECLSQASYLIGDDISGFAAVVDPRRDVAVYLDDAAALGLRIAYVIETHVHADFLSGHLELSAASGAEIVYGDAAAVDFPVRRVADGERLTLGSVQLEFLSTPGHTPESVSVVIWEHADDATPFGVLTGDTMFIGDVGRPDLLSSAGLSAEDLAGRLHESLHGKLLVLPDATAVYPAHGAGSSCGRNLSTAIVSTIGEQRRTNAALAPMSRDQFIEMVTKGQPVAPGYFAYDADRNRRSGPLLDVDPPRAVDLGAVLAAASDGDVIVLDVRDPDEFAAGHVVGAVNVGLGGRFAEAVGALLDPDSDLMLVSDAGAAAEARIRLGRIGFDRVIGALEAPDAQYAKSPGSIRRSTRLGVSELSRRISETPSLQVIDVRNDTELTAGTIGRTTHVPLAALRDRLEEIDLSRPIVVHCAGGYRSSVAASWLRRIGATDVVDLRGGYDAWVRSAPR